LGRVLGASILATGERAEYGQDYWQSGGERVDWNELPERVRLSHKLLSVEMMGTVLTHLWEAPARRRDVAMHAWARHGVDDSRFDLFIAKTARAGMISRFSRNGEEWLDVTSEARQVYRRPQTIAADCDYFATAIRKRLRRLDAS
jgi:hypothetical protein